jgi:transcriptional regulator with XRE-family HTH domain
MMDLRRLGAVLREQREELGIPAAEVARRVGVSPTYVWMVEHARPRKGGEPSRPGEDLLRRWALALRMDERYVRQVLRLAGYEESDRAPARSRRPRITSSPFPEPGPAMMSALFDAAPPYPVPSSGEGPRELLADVLADELLDLLQRAEAQGRLEETADLLEEYLGFLRHRLNRAGESA